MNLALSSAAAAAAKSLQACPTLCSPTDGSPPGSPIPGALQTGILEWVPFPSPVHGSEVSQACRTPSDPVDCSPPGSSVRGIFQARVLEWGAIAFSAFFCIFVIKVFERNVNVDVFISVLTEAGLLLSLGLSS